MLLSYFWDIHQACVICTHTSVSHFQISCIMQINHWFFLCRSVIHETLSLKSNCICPTMKASIMRATCFPGAGPQFSSTIQSCLTLCNPINYSTPGLPVHHQLPESTQTYVHWVGDDIQPSHPLSSWAISDFKQWCCESVALTMPANLENSAVATGLEKVSFCSNPKKGQCQRKLKVPHKCTHFTC